MESSIQLLHFPQLVIAEVLNLLDVKEQLIFALCSQRATNLFKILRNKSVNPKLMIYDWYCIGYAVEHDIDSIVPEHLIYVGSEPSSTNRPTQPVIGIGDVSKVKMGNEFIFLYLKRLSFEFATYWENQTIGIKIVVDYLCDLFGVGIYLLELEYDQRKIIERFQDSSVEIIAVRNSLEAISNNDFNFIMSRSKSKVLFAQNYSKNVQLNLHLHNVNVDSLLLTHAYWLTIEHLMSIDCVEIDIMHRRLSNEELNRFLIHWINGGNPRLKCFVVNIRDFNERLALKDINVQKSNKQPCIYKSFHKNLRFENLEIRRNDGLIALIRYAIYGASFSFAVWPDNIDTLHRRFLKKTMNYLVSPPF